jgi:hypothetical protein
VKRVSMRGYYDEAAGLAVWAVSCLCRRRLSGAGLCARFRRGPGGSRDRAKVGPVGCLRRLAVWAAAVPGRHPVRVAVCGPAVPVVSSSACRLVCAPLSGAVPAAAGTAPRSARLAACADWRYGLLPCASWRAAEAGGMRWILRMVAAAGAGWFVRLLPARSRRQPGPLARVSAREGAPPASKFDASGGGLGLQDGRRARG